MARDTRISPDATHAMFDALTRLLDGGFFDLYSATEQHLARLTLGTPAFRRAANLRAVARPIGSAPAFVQGRAARFRARRADGATLVISGSVGEESEDKDKDREFDLLLNSIELQQNATVSVPEWVIS